MEPQVFFEVQIAVAEGCMSSAWVLGVVGVHPLQLGLFPLKAQEDVWSKDATTLVSSSYQPVGKVEKADGGFYLSGQWGFSSGCQHCDWAFLGALIFPEAGGPPEYRTPSSCPGAITRSSTPGTRGRRNGHDREGRPRLRARASHPQGDGRVPVPQSRPGGEYGRPVQTALGGGVHPRRLRRSAQRRTPGGFLEIAKSRVSTNTGMATKADPFALSAAATTAAELEGMRTTLMKAFDDMMDDVRHDREISIDRRVFYKYQASRVARRCADLTDELLLLSGARGIFTENAIVRPWLDLKAGRAHIANNSNRGGADARLLSTPVSGRVPVARLESRKRKRAPGSADARFFTHPVINGCRC